MWKIDDAGGRLRTMMLESAQWAGAHIWRRAHECEDGIGILIVHPSNHGAGQLMSIFSPHGAPTPTRSVDEVDWSHELASLDEQVEAWELGRKAGTFISSEDPADPMAVCVVPARRKALLRIVTGCVGEPAGETLRAQLENGPASCYPEVTVVVDEMRLAWRNAEELLPRREG